VDRALLRALRGDDATADVEAATRLRVERGVTDPQWESYELWTAAMGAFSGGFYDEVRRLGERAVELTGYFAPLAFPLVIRSALWAGDAPGLQRLDQARSREPAVWTAGQEDPGRR
jgi:hypothetical protein